MADDEATKQDQPGMVRATDDAADEDETEGHIVRPSQSSDDGKPDPAEVVRPS